jgi:predicted TIM-barrel fold metal-dependent hydrolase
LAREFADVVIPFGSVDPRRGPEAVALARQLIAAGAQGFKFHPSLQAFWPNDEQHLALYDVIAEAPVCRHCFTTVRPVLAQGSAGGGGIKLHYSNPMLVDDKRPRASSRYMVTC